MVPHCTPEQLALAALREELPAEDAAHLETCARCRAEVASLRRGVDALAVPQLAAPGAAVPPPPGVWAAIAAATGVSSAPRSDVVAAPAPAAVPGPAVAPRTVPAAPPGATPATVPAPPPGATPATVTALRPRRSRLLLAAAAALVVGAGIGAGAVALGGRDEDGLAVAAAALDPLEDSGASGEARVLERQDGTRALRLDLTAADLEDGFYEVWLIDEAVEDMYSLGVVRGSGQLTLEVPPGVDLTEFPVVDVSVEPLDGDPTHSGDSVARGILES